MARLRDQTLFVEDDIANLLDEAADRLEELGEPNCWCCDSKGTHDHANCEHPCCPDNDPEPRVVAMVPSNESPVVDLMAALEDSLAKARVSASAVPDFVPCSICGNQPGFSAHDGGPKGHPYLTGPL